MNYKHLLCTLSETVLSLKVSFENKFIATTDGYRTITRT